MTELDQINVLNLLNINPKEEEQRIIKFVQEKIKELNKNGAVIGLSGGLDSSTCAYLLKKALGNKKILALILPERDNSSVNMDHARLVAKTLGLKTIEIDITDVLSKIGVYDIGPKKLETEDDFKNLEKRRQMGTKIIGPYVMADTLTLLHGGKPSKSFFIFEKLKKKEIYDKTAFGLTKVRMRMVYLYFYAWQHKYAVIGTTDKTEYTIGVYDEHGDGANDITLLRHLYKTQIKKLAEFIGVPKEITQKPSSGDIYGNVPNEVAFGISYEKLDSILSAIERGFSEKQLLEIAPKKVIDHFKRCMEIAKIGRSLPLNLS